MIAYFIWDRIRCIWIKAVTSLAVWRSIPHAVGTLVCRGVPLAMLGLPPGSTAVPYTPASSALPRSAGLSAPPPVVSASPGRPIPPADTYRPLLVLFPPIGGAPSVPPPASETDTIGPPGPTVGTRMPSILDQVAPPLPAQPVAITPVAFVPPGTPTGAPVFTGAAGGLPVPPAASAIPEPSGLAVFGAIGAFAAWRLGRRRR